MGAEHQQRHLGQIHQQGMEGSRSPQQLAQQEGQPQKGGGKYRIQGLAQVVLEMQQQKVGVSLYQYGGVAGVDHIIGSLGAVEGIGGEEDCGGENRQRQKQGGIAHPLPPGQVGQVKKSGKCPEKQQQAEEGKGEAQHRSHKAGKSGVQSIPCPADSGGGQAAEDG